MGLLQQAPVSEEHRTLVGTVIKRISSVKSRLDEAFMSLLRGFEVRNMTIFVIFEFAECKVHCV